MERTGLRPIDELIQLAKNGNGLAFTALWDRHIDQLRSYIKNRFKNIDDYEKYLYAVAENEKDSGIYAMYTNPSSPMTLTFLTGPNNWMTVGNFYWDADNGTLNPDDLFIGTFTEEYREYCHRMVDWAKHGVWPSNAITNVTHINDLFNDDKSASDICMYKSANEDIIRQRAKGNDAEYFNIMPENASTRISPYNYDALAITAFCKNPERAGLAIDVMKNDSIITNLLQGGIEGVHYILGEDGSRSNGPDSEKYPWSGWAWCLRTQLNPSGGGILPEVIDFDAREELLRPGATVPLKVELEDARDRDVSDPAAANVMSQLKKLAGCEAHSTVLLSPVDENIFRRLKINLTCDPHYQTQKLYHP